MLGTSLGNYASSIVTSSIPTTNLFGWWEADFGVTKSYGGNGLSQYSGTISTSTLVSTGDDSDNIFPNMLIRVGLTDVYTVQSVSTSLGITTITVVGTLSATYTNAQLFTEQVSQWNDKSVNGFNATPLSGDLFSYLASATNGKPALVIATTGTAYDLPSGIFSLPNGDNTIFVVGKAFTQDTRMCFFAVSNTGSNAGVSLNYTDNGTGDATYNNSASGNFAIFPSSGNITQTVFNILRGRRNGTTQAISFNNAAEVSNTNAVSTATANGAGFNRAIQGVGNTPGQVQAILVYNTSLSAPDIATVQTYLQTKYSTP